jgi:hypothetical protein
MVESEKVRQKVEQSMPPGLSTGKVTDSTFSDEIDSSARSLIAGASAGLSVGGLVTAGLMGVGAAAATFACFLPVTIGVAVAGAIASYGLKKYVEQETRSDTDRKETDQ